MLPASAVVLSTGGAGQVYARTTNPGNATGDGMAMALRAGALLMDMGSCNSIPPRCICRRVLLSCCRRHSRRRWAASNIKGELFMHGTSGRRTGAARCGLPGNLVGNGRHPCASCLFDVTHLGAAFVKRRFPTIYATCLRYDIDMTEEWIPVSPARIT